MVSAISRLPPLVGDDPATAYSDGACTIVQTALVELHQAHRGRLHRFFTRNGAPQDADDLVQESFVRFARARVNRPETAVERPEAYLTRIALNLLRERARIAVRRSTASHIPVDDVALADSDPVAALEARDLLERLQASLARLSPKSRLVFLAHRRDGISYKEISRREGISEKAVQRRMSKAIAHVARARAKF